MSSTVSQNIAWCAPPPNLVLGGNEVHVWRATLNSTETRVQELLQTLTQDEIVRANRFHFQKDREHFIVARGLLRTILARYLNIKPKSLKFCYSAFGKPAIAGDLGGLLRFNLSHSHEMALYAITHGREVGIDIEYVRPDLKAGEIAGRFFSASEIAALHALPTEAQTEAFFSCWTRKEAFIKAIGEGLSFALDRFSVSLIPSESKVLLSVPENPTESLRWSLQDLRLGSGYSTAIAVEGHDWQLKCWHV